MYHYTIDPNQLVTGDRGPASKYEISIDEGDFKGELEIVWDSEPLRVRCFVMMFIKCACTCTLMAK